MIRMENITKTYGSGQVKTHALRGVNLQIQGGDFVVITGKSGCGKTTLLNIIGGADRASSGVYTYNDQVITDMGVRALSEFRNDHISYIFQEFYLIPELNIIDNVGLPLGYRGVGKKERIRLSSEALEMVGIREMAKKRTNQLSGGEKQRVAIARALVYDNPLILADEPTGNLDNKNTDDIMKLLKEVNARGKTVIMVTHDLDLTSYANKAIEIKDGVYEESFLLGAEKQKQRV